MNDLVPPEFYLGQNYPNPFKEKTTIKYCVAYKTKVRITIYDPEGEMIDRLVDEVKESGTYEVEFSSKGRSASGRYPESGCRHLESGTYFYQMKVGNYLSGKEMILLKETNMSVQPK